MPSNSFFRVRFYSVLVDGQEFGPFHHVRIANVVKEGLKGPAGGEGTPLTFPIKTFLPLDV